MQSAVEAIAKTGHINSFVDIYHFIFTLTIRIVGSHELAEDAILRARFEYYFDLIEKSATTFLVMSPSFLWPATIQRNDARFLLYLLLDSIVKKRRKSGKAPDEDLKQLSERGDGMPEVAYKLLSDFFYFQNKIYETLSFVAFNVQKIE